MAEKESYDGMLARCRALQLFLEVAVVDDERVMDLFADAGLPSPAGLLADVRARFDVEGKGLRYEQFQSFLRVAALSHPGRGTASKEAATKQLLATLTEGLGSSGVVSSSRMQTVSQDAQPPESVHKIDMGFTSEAAVQLPTETRVAKPVYDTFASSTKAARVEVREQRRADALRDANAPGEGSAEWADLDKGLLRSFRNACRSSDGEDTAEEMQSYQFYKLILSSGALAAGPVRVPPKEADAVFTGVRGFKSGVDFDGFKECLALVAQKVFPDEDPVAAYYTLGRKYLVDKLPPEDTGR